MPLKSLLPLVFIGYVALELLFESIFVKHFGFLALFFEIILSAVLGVFIWVKQTKSLRDFIPRLLDILSNGFNMLKMSLLVYLGAFLLILPGIFSDFLGLIFIGISAIFYKKKVDSAFYIKESSKDFAHFSQQERKRKGARDDEKDIIDVEVISSKK